ncbi:MAG: dihydrofolate reductase [Pirellulales bacterium]
MSLSLLVAVAKNGVIGCQGDLPWHLSADLRRFKRLTMGHAIVMGRKTWESIGRPLPGRQMLVVSRQRAYRADGVQVARSLPQALEMARESGDLEPFVVGGAEIYRLALPLTTRLYLTRVLAEVEGDTHFPEIIEADWLLVSSESHQDDTHNDHPFCFEVYERREDSNGR